MIQDWRTAHRIAHIASLHAQHDLGIDRSGYIDVLEAIRLMDIPLKVQKIPSLFGIYISPTSDGPGILLNSGLSPVALRHTAAHELGHHHFKHGDSADRYLDPWDTPAHGWSGPEMLAEAFAAWFIMPKAAVVSGLRILGLGRPRTAIDSYQLATLLGASFRGLCRHLVNLRLANSSDATAWAKVGRGKLRKQLAGPIADQYRGEVHKLTPTMREVTIHVHSNDIIVLPRFSQISEVCDYLPDGVELLPTSTEHEDDLYLAVTEILNEPFTLSLYVDYDHSRAWEVHVRPAYIRDGIDLGWLETHQDHY